MTKWRYKSNVTDEMLIAWDKRSALEKMKWLGALHAIWGKALPKNKRKHLRELHLHSRH